MMRELAKNSGSILILVIWMLIVLTIFSVGLARGIRAEMTLAKYSLNTMKARFLAWAGFNYAISKIAEDSKDEGTKNFDDLFQCAVTLKEDQTPESVFDKVSLKDGYFRVSYDGMHDGLSDEERKINLNALTIQNHSVFKELLMILGSEERSASDIATATLDWRDENKEGKRRPFDHIEELLLIKGMTMELFKKVKGFVTVFPKNPSRLGINFATAREEVLWALAYSVSGPAINTQPEDAKSMVEKLIAFRAGSDGIEGTRDDKPLDFNEMGLNKKEESIYLAMEQYRIKSSQYIRIRAEGVENKAKVHSTLEAIVERKNLSVVAWQRD